MCSNDGASQVGESFTEEQYRLKLRYYDVEAQKVVRTDIVKSRPLTKNGGGGRIPDDDVIKTVKATMAGSGN